MDFSKYFRKGTRERLAKVQVSYWVDKRILVEIIAEALASEQPDPNKWADHILKGGNTRKNIEKLVRENIAEHKHKHYVIQFFDKFAEDHSEYDEDEIALLKEVATNKAYSAFPEVWSLEV